MERLMNAIRAALGLRRPPPLVARLAPPLPADGVAAPKLQLARRRVPTLSEALYAFVREARLEGIAIAPGALKEADYLDSAPEAAAIVPKIGRAIVALNAYALDPGRRRHVDFAYWCKNSGNPLAWYANQVVISEGVKVSDDWRFLSDRVRNVAPELDLSGRAVMESHIRISTGHSGHSPRLYFYDDAGGKTGQVHIGFIGGHAHIRTWRHAA